MARMVPAQIAHLRQLAGKAERRASNRHSGIYAPDDAEELERPTGRGLTMRHISWRYTMINDQYECELCCRMIQAHVATSDDDRMLRKYWHCHCGFSAIGTYVIDEIQEQP